jgi:hypothetical protein
MEPNRSETLRRLERMSSRETERRSQLAPSHFERGASPFLLLAHENRDVGRKHVSRRTGAFRSDACGLVTGDVSRAFPLEQAASTVLIPASPIPTGCQVGGTKVRPLSLMIGSAAGRVVSGLRGRVAMPLHAQLVVH